MIYIFSFQFNCQRFNAVFNICSVISRRAGHISTCFLDRSHQYSTRQFFQATVCFSTQIVIGPLVKTNHVCRIDFCQPSEEIFCRVGVRAHNTWFDSPCYSLLSYFGMVVCFETFKGNMKQLENFTIINNQIDTF